MIAHATPVKTYCLIFGGLLLLTGLTVAASLAPLGGLHTLVALAIASAKAALVLLYFMHLADSSRLTWVVALSGLLWLAILIILTMSDYLTREWWRVTDG
ncbi:MAG: cytochrome C oxidase subunit IV family protein [Gemmataceae bacterium]|nr:cytochrome C oxidase subunit IV family protein [Gemmataceae bacterium]